MKRTIYSRLSRFAHGERTIAPLLLYFFPPLSAISTSKLVINCRTTNIIVI